MGAAEILIRNLTDEKLQLQFKDFSLVHMAQFEWKKLINVKLMRRVDTFMHLADAFIQSDLQMRI